MKIIISTLVTLTLALTSCENQSKKAISLSIALKNINHIETSSYVAAFYSCYPGDTVAIGEKLFEFYKECVLPSDTSVGASFMRFEVDDTTKMTYAYDGKTETTLHWQEYNYNINDFSSNYYSYRVVMAPFFAKSKAIIEYTLSNKDSIQIDSVVNENEIVYKISILNKEIEFVGRLPINITESGYDKSVMSEYVIWVNKTTKLPYRIQRTLTNNTLTDEIKDLKINNLSKADFEMAKYIPKDMSEKFDKPSDSYNVLLNTLAFNYTLKDMKGQIHKLEDESSKVYMINLTSMTCGPCRKSISFLKELNKKYDEKDFSFVSLYDEKEKTELKKYMEEEEIDYNILLVNKDVEEKYKESLIPTFLLLDKDKRIIKILPGFVEGETELEIEKVIDSLI